MSDVPTTISPPGWWRRVIDKLAGGPPNLETLDKRKGKPWFVRFNVTLFMLAGSFVVLVAPEFVTHLNGIPDEARLQTLQARVLQTNLVEPHLIVELADGNKLGVEWPVPISGGRGGFRSNVWSDTERLRLPGCLVTVRGMPLRLVVDDRFRVWELDCPERAIRIGLDKTTRDSNGWERARALPALVIFPGFYLFVFVIFLREKRGYL